MPDFITVDGQSIFRPGVYSKVDASALGGLGPATTGTIAVLGIWGGALQPKVPYVTSSAAILRRILPIRDATILGKLAFQPSRDPRIPNGARQLVLVRVNPATRASRTLVDGDDADSVRLLAAGWGAVGNDVKTKVEDGSAYSSNQYADPRGKKLTAINGTVTEILDNIGFNFDMFRVEYFGEETGIQSCTVALTPLTAADAFVVRWTVEKAENQTWDTSAAKLAWDGAVTFAIAVAEGQNKSFSITGVRKTDGQEHTDTVTLTAGQTSVASTYEYSSVSSIAIPDLTGVGTTVDISCDAFHLSSETYDTVQKVVDRVNAFNDQGFRARLATSSTTFLISDMDALAASNIISLDSEIAAATDYDPTAASPVRVIDGRIIITLSAVDESDRDFVIVGKRRDTQDDDDGDEITETVTIPAGETIAESVNEWQAGNTTEIQAPDTLGDGITWTYECHGRCLMANQWDFIAKVNARSSLVAAARLDTPTAQKIPANAGLALLSGGGDGVASATDWQEALDALRTQELTVNHVVPITDRVATADVPAILSKVVDHCEWMAGRGRNERNAFLGAPPDRTLTQLREQRILLNSRHAALLCQKITIYDESGQPLSVHPCYTALLAAACDAGRATGEGIAWRYVDIVAALDHSGGSWAAIDDGETLVENGLMLVERDWRGWRWVRDVTTYGIDNNPVFCSVVANESLNNSVRNVRRALEVIIGRLNWSGTEGDIKALVKAELDRQKAAREIKDYDPRSVDISDLGNGFDVSYDVAVMESVYFIRQTAHVIRMPAVAA